MANFLFLFLFFSVVLGVAVESSLHHPIIRAQSSGGEKLWCVAKNNVDDSALLSALDWACGPGGADCGAIQQSGACYDKRDIIGMASLAFNNYCLKHGMNAVTCNFSNTAALTSLDPSHGNCKYPSSTSSAGGKFSGSTTVGGPASPYTISGSNLGGGEVHALHFLLFVTVAAIFL